MLLRIRSPRANIYRNTHRKDAMIGAAVISDQSKLQGLSKSDAAEQFQDPAPPMAPPSGQI